MAIVATPLIFSSAYASPDEDATRARVMENLYGSTHGLVVSTGIGKENIIAPNNGETDKYINGITEKHDNAEVKVYIPEQEDFNGTFKSAKAKKMNETYLQLTNGNDNEKKMDTMLAIAIPIANSETPGKIAVAAALTLITEVGIEFVNTRQKMIAS